MRDRRLILARLDTKLGTAAQKRLAAHVVFIQSARLSHDRAVAEVQF
jgi:hypothetical protein